MLVEGRFAPAWAQRRGRGERTGEAATD